MHEVRAYRAVARLFAAALLAVVTGWLGAAPALSQGTQPARKFSSKPGLAR